MTAFLPWLGQTPWLRLEWPVKWAYEMDLRGELREDRVDISVVQRAHLPADGPRGSASA